MYQNKDQMIVTTEWKLTIDFKFHKERPKYKKSNNSKRKTKIKIQRKKDQKKNLKIKIN